MRNSSAARSGLPEARSAIPRLLRSGASAVHTRAERRSGMAAAAKSWPAICRSPSSRQATAIGGDALDQPVLLNLRARHGQHGRHGVGGFGQSAGKMLGGFFALPFLERDQAEQIGESLRFRPSAFQRAGKLARLLDASGIKMRKGLREGLLDGNLLLHGAVK